jgi:hypothetical protein
MASLTVVAAPEGAAVMAGGATVAAIGGGTSIVGLGMQVLGAGINFGVSGWSAFQSSAIQGAATVLDSVVDHFFPNLPDVLSAFGANPIDAGADAIGHGLGSCQ